MILFSTCPACGRTGAAPCEACRSQLRPVGEVVPAPVGVDACVALFAYEGAGRALVTGLKYRNQRAPIAWLGAALAAQLDEARARVPADAVVTWVPTTTSRRHARGFDQAELLGQATARALSRPARRLLRRAGGPTQTGRSRLERLNAPHVSAVRPVHVPVVLVDDVLTTGSSMAAAASALRAAGAPSVVAAVVALTPDLRSSRGASPPKEVIHPADLKELTGCLPTGRQARRPAGRHGNNPDAR